MQHLQEGGNNLFSPALRMHRGPLGNLAGMRWCGETNRYYSTATRRDLGLHDDVGNVRGSSDNHSSATEAVRVTPVQHRIIETLPPTRRKRERVASIECSICLRQAVDHRIDPRMRFVQLPCLHSFHLYCIEQWLSSRSGSCPLCRGSVDTSLAVAAESLGSNRSH